MKFCIPFSVSGQTFTECEIKKLSPASLADAQEAFEEKTEFHGILEILAGGISLVKDVDGQEVTEKHKIRSICRHMPYQTAEQVGLDIMVLLNKEDKIETVFNCPRCGHQMYSGDEDKLSNLPREYGEGGILEYSFQPIDIKAKDGTILQQISSFNMRYPNINDCISAAMVVSKNKPTRRQYQIYANAIIDVNGEAATEEWKRTWGRFVIERLDFDDLSRIGSDMQIYGLIKELPKVCTECGKEWRATVSTGSFFALGHR